MHLPRMTTRRWMMAIVALAFLFAGVVEGPRLWILRGRYRSLAGLYGDLEARYRGLLSVRQDVDYYATWQPRGPEPPPARLASLRARVSYFGAMRAKYERAASRPWRPVAPDPAPPE